MKAVIFASSFSTEFFEVELQIGLEHNLPIGIMFRDNPKDQELFKPYSNLAFSLISHGNKGH